jgi:hypothetical protein
MLANEGHALATVGGTSQAVTGKVKMSRMSTSAALARVFAYTLA